MPPPRNFPSATPTRRPRSQTDDVVGPQLERAPWPWTRTWSPSSAAETTCCGRASTSTVWPGGWRSRRAPAGVRGGRPCSPLPPTPATPALQGAPGTARDPHGQPLHHRATPRLLGCSTCGDGLDPRLAHVGRDRIHLNTEGHTRVAQAAHRPLACVRRPGLGQPCLRMVRGARADELREHAEWVKVHTAPWVQRRVRHLVGRGSPGQETEPSPRWTDPSSRRRCGASIPPMTQCGSQMPPSCLGSPTTLSAAWSSPSACGPPRRLGSAGRGRRPGRRPRPRTSPGLAHVGPVADESARNRMRGLVTAGHQRQGDGPESNYGSAAPSASSRSCLARRSTTSASRSARSPSPASSPPMS